MVKTLLKKALPILLLSLLALSGCANQSGLVGTPSNEIATAGTTLQSIQMGIVSTHEAFREPCKAGTVPKVTCDQVHGLALEAGPAFDAAVDAEILAIRTGSTADYQIKKLAIDKLLADMVALALKYAVPVPVNAGGVK